MSSPSDLAIVDDHDRAIQYSDSGWLKGGIGEEFAGTSTYGVRQGAFATFTFTGSSVTVYGTLNPIADANITFQLDDAPAAVAVLHATPDRDSTYQSALFRSGTIIGGSHTLFITYDTDLQEDGVIILDYITYTPTNDTPRNGLRYLVDDRDSRIRYGLGWVNDQVRNGFTMQTTTHSGTSESSFEFDFDGTGVSMFGPVSSASAMPRVEISVDDSTPSIFSPSSPSESILYGQEIFSVDNLRQGPHKMVVTLKNDNIFTYDYILVQPGAAVSPTTSSTEVSSTGTTSASSASSSETSDAPSDNEGNSSVLAGAIAGGVVGGIVILTAIFVGIYWRMRRRKRSNQPVQYEPSEAYFQAEPFNPPVLVSSEPMSTSRENISVVQEHRSSSPALRTATISRAQSPPETKVYLQPPEDAVVLQDAEVPHRDSGWRFRAGEAIPPPNYTAN